MTRNTVAAHASATAREIDTKLVIGNFNGLPVVDKQAASVTSWAGYHRNYLNC